MRTLFSDSNIPIMQVAFMPFLPNPITNPSTVYTVMENFVALTENYNKTFY